MFERPLQPEGPLCQAEGIIDRSCVGRRVYGQQAMGVRLLRLFALRREACKRQGVLQERGMHVR